MARRAQADAVARRSAVHSAPPDPADNTFCNLQVTLRVGPAAFLGGMSPRYVPPNLRQCHIRTQGYGQGPLDLNLLTNTGEPHRAYPERLSILPLPRHARHDYHLTRSVITPGKGSCLWRNNHPQSPLFVLWSC